VMEIVMLLLVAAGLVVSAVLVVVVVAFIARRNALPVMGEPGAFPCPKCKAFVPSGKRSCGACGATVG
jgi:hypothetical protein